MWWQNHEKSDSKMMKHLKNEVICFTGKSPYSRSQMIKFAEANGARVTLTVTDATTLLVIGNRSGSKLEKALLRSVTIIADETFLNIIKK